jgi:hypothetical protein
MATLRMPAQRVDRRLVLRTDSLAEDGNQRA